MGTRSAHTLNCFAESELQGPGVAGETTAVVQVGGDGGLGREVTGGDGEIRPHTRGVHTVRPTGCVNTHGFPIGGRYSSLHLSTQHNI